MSSEHDENGELLEEGSMKSDVEKNDSPPSKKFHGLGEPSKPRRRGRRGKKRKQRKESVSADGKPEESVSADGKPEESVVAHHSQFQMAGPNSPAWNPDSPAWNSDEELHGEVNTYNDIIISPINAPKAPKNSTQFIIDDHNECRLYMSFETPDPYPTEPLGEDAAYRNIEYEYESPQDFDNSAYYDRDFELSYKSNRFEELLRLPREDLISGLKALESRLKELSEDLVKENPSPILEKLQAELLELQEKHFDLKETNSKLTALATQSENAPNKSFEGVQVNPMSEQLSENHRNDVVKNEEPYNEDLNESAIAESMIVSSDETKELNEPKQQPRLESLSESIGMERRLHGTLCISENKPCGITGRKDTTMHDQTISRSNLVYCESFELSSYGTEPEEQSAVTV